MKCVRGSKLLRMSTKKFHDALDDLLNGRCQYRPMFWHGTGVKPKRVWIYRKE